MTAKCSGLDSILMRLWRTIVLAQAGFKCELCGSREVVEAHHIISKRHIWTRYEPKNGIASCRKCHEQAWRIRQWLESNRPKQWRWIVRQERKVRTGERFDFSAMERRLEREGAYSV